MTQEELDTIGAPPPTETWFPVKHAAVIETVKTSLTDAGFVITKARYGLARNDARMFATLVLESALGCGVSLAVGIRNSIDKSFPLGFCAGSSVFVCDNLAFRSELLVKRKHTRFGAQRFQGEIGRAVKTLDAFKTHETNRVKALQLADLSDQQAESLMLRSFEAGNVSHRVLPKVISEWRKPSFEEFAERTAWSLLNAFTTALGPRAKTNPQEYARTTMRLGALIDDAVGIRPFALPAPAVEGNGHAQ